MRITETLNPYFKSSVSRGLNLSVSTTHIKSGTEPTNISSPF